MVFQKLLSLLRRDEKEQKPPENVTSSVRVNPVKIVVLPPTPAQEKPSQHSVTEVAMIPPEQGTIEERSEDEESCETPRPLEEFHAISVEVASKKAAEKGLVILFKEIDKCDLFGRRRVYFGLTPESAQKLLRCLNDAKPAQEFSKAETIILNSLVAKRWLRRIRDKEGTYYCGLSQQTAANLQKQLKGRLASNL